MDEQCRTGKNARFRFTKSTLSTLTEPGYYRDSEIRGLAVRLNKNGSLTFIVNRRFRSSDGLTRPERIIIWSGMLSDKRLTLDAIRHRAAEIIAEQARDRNPAEELRQMRSGITIGQLFEFYEQNHLSKRKSAVETAKVFKRSFQHWNDVPAATVTRAMVHALQQEIAQKRGKYAANRAMQQLRAVFNRAITEGFVQHNPAARITLFAEIPRSRVLREDERQRFLAELAAHPSENFRDFIHLALASGQRKANVLAMAWDDIDLPSARWTVPGELTKNGLPHVVMLTAHEIEILERRKSKARDSRYVFPGTGRTGHYAEPKRAWTTLRRRAGLTSLQLHDLRRTNACALVSTGASVPIIKSAMNHRDVATTLQVYALGTKKDEAEARERAVRSLFNQQ